MPEGDKPGCAGTGEAMTPPISRQPEAALMPQENLLGAEATSAAGRVRICQLLAPAPSHSW